MMIEGTIVKFWQEFAQKWKLVESEKNEIRPTRGNYDYISIYDEIMSLDDDEYDDDEID